MKPTVGLVSRAFIVPISPAQDTAGPMTRTVRDAALLLGAIAGVDPRDEATAAARDRAVLDYTAALSETGLKGARIGIVRARYFGYSAQPASSGSVLGTSNSGQSPATASDMKLAQIGPAVGPP